MNTPGRAGKSEGEKTWGGQGRFANTLVRQWVAGRVVRGTGGRYAPGFLRPSILLFRVVRACVPPLRNNNNKKNTNNNSNKNNKKDKFGHLGPIGDSSPSPHSD